MFARLASLLLRRRRVVWVALAIVTAAAGWVATGIRFDFTPQEFHKGIDDSFRFSEEFKETFGHDDAALLVVLESPDALGKAAMNWQRAIAADVRGIEYVERVLSVPELGAIPLLEGMLFNKARTVAAVVGYIDPDARDVDTTMAIVRDVKAAVAARPAPPGSKVHIGGLPALRADIVENLQADQMLFQLISASLLIVALALIFRRFGGVVLPLGVVGLGLCWLVAVLVLTGQSFNIISNIMPVLLLVIGLANGVHVMSRHAEESARNPEGATRRTMTAMGLACLLTFGTSAIGFLSLTGARSSLLRGVGWQTAAGMGLLYVATLVVFGTLLPRFRPPRPPKPSRAWLFSHAGDRPGRTMLVAGLLVAGALWAARDIEVDSRMLETYDPGHPSLETIRVVDENLGGILPLDISLKGDTITKPETVARVKELTRYAAGFHGVIAVRSYADVPHPQFLAPDGKHGRVTIRVRDLGTRALVAMFGKIEERARQLLPGLDVRLTGDAYLYARALDSFVRDLILSFLAASAAIFLVIALALRSVRLGMIAIIPNMTPIVLTLGYLGLRGYDLNASNAIVFAISLGVAVDDTIHFLVRYKEELKRDGDVRAAVRRTLDGAGRAIVLTSVLVVSGLGVLMMSDFVPTRRFAELTSITMASALVGDLLLLPAGLVLFSRQK